MARGQNWPFYRDAAVIDQTIIVSEKIKVLDNLIDSIEQIVLSILLLFLAMQIWIMKNHREIDNALFAELVISLICTLRSQKHCLKIACVDQSVR